MKVTLLGAVTALATFGVAQAVPVAEAEAGRPRYYFPRMVKRQQFGGRDLGADVLDGNLLNITGILGQPSSTTTNQPSSSESDDSNPTPDTTTRKTTSQDDTSGAASSTTTAAGLLPGLGSDLGSAASNLLGGSSSTTTASTTAGTASTTTNSLLTTPPPQTTTTSTGDGGLLGSLTSIVNSLTSEASSFLAPPTTTTVSTSQATAPPSSSTSSGITIGLSSVLSGLLGGTSTTGQAPPTSTPGAISSIISQASSFLSKAPSVTGSVISSVSVVVSSVGSIATSVASDPNSIASQLTVTPTSTENPLSIVSSLYSSVFASPTTTGVVGSTTLPFSLPSLTSGTNLPTSVSTASSSGILSIPTSLSITLLPPPPTSTTTFVIPTTTPSGVTGPGTGTTVTATSIPTTSVSLPGSGSTTTAPTLTQTPVSTPDSGDSSTEVSSASITSGPTTTSAQSATDTALSSSVGITSAPSSEPPPPSSVSGSSVPTTLPTSLPHIIQPSSGVPQAPADSTLVQLGWTYGLNYQFVYNSTQAQFQIFNFTPGGVSHAIDTNNLWNSPETVVMQYLQPYNTLAKKGFITTLAMMYIPSDAVSSVQAALLNPNSLLYNHPDPNVRALMAMIDPTIPLLAGTSLSGGSSLAPGGGSGSSSGNNNGAAGGDGSSSSGGVKPSSVGIGVGVVAGAAVYGAAMFFVARRYKKRRAALQRSTSVSTGSTGSERANEGTDLIGRQIRDSYGSGPTHNPAMAETSRYDMGSRQSDRSRETGHTYISRPVATQSSLGWN